MGGLEVIYADLGAGDVSGDGQYRRARPVAVKKAV